MRNAFLIAKHLKCSKLFSICHEIVYRLNKISPQNYFLIEAHNLLSKGNLSILPVTTKQNTQQITTSKQTFSVWNGGGKFRYFSPSVNCLGNIFGCILNTHEGSKPKMR